MKSISLFILAAMIAACSTFVTPQNPREALAAAEISYQGVLSATSQLIEVDLVSRPEAVAIAENLDRLYGAIKMARMAINTGNEDLASVQLRLVDVLLITLTAELNRIRNKERLE